MSNTPSDAEIDKLAAEHLKAFAQFTGAGDVWVEGEVAFARAVLSKWGTPQPVVREPLTPEQISAMSRKHPAEDLCGWSYRMGIADAEAHHGITQKGGSNADT